MSLYKLGLMVGAESPPASAKSGKGAGTIAAVLGITALVFVTSPGGKHFVKHGRLPR